MSARRYAPDVHLLCPDPECVGNDLPAGDVGDATCRYCEGPLETAGGNVLAAGPAPLVDGAPPRGFDALMDALREDGAEVQLVELTAVAVDGKLLVSALADDGELLSVEVCEGERAAEVAHVMGLLA